MKRSEFVKIVNEVADAERNRIKQELDSISAEKNIEKLAKTFAVLVDEIPFTSACTAAMIIEKSGLLVFDPEAE